MAVDLDPICLLVVALSRGEDVRARVVQELARHVSRVVERLPAGWFDAADTRVVERFSERLFEACGTTPLASVPFSGRTAFGACLVEPVDVDSFHRHVFYGRRSLLRGLLRTERAARLAAEPSFARRLDLYLALGERLRPLARRLPGTPVRWALPRPAAVLGEESLVARLTERGTIEVDVLLEDALRLGGPRTQAGLARVASAVLGADLCAVAVGHASEPARWRAALELAEDEDICEVEAEPPPRGPAVYRHAEWAVEVRGGIVTQICGPSALTLRIHGRHLPLVRGEPSELPVAEMGSILEVVDVRGRQFRLELEE